MASTALLSDSTANAPPEMVAKYNIHVVPLYIKIGETVYRDTVDISAAEFYEKLPHTNPLPTTSQPSVGDFEVAYKKLRDGGATGIISIHLSSGISGTVNSATLAAQQLADLPIEIIDTRCAGASHLMALQLAGEALQAGFGLQETAALVRNMLDQQKTLFTVDTLEYLYKGGRIGGAAALVGSLLQFKPLLYFKDCRIDALERIRKSSRALSRVVEVMVEWVGGETPVRAVIMHAAAENRAQELAALARQNLNITELYIEILTPVLGAHVGNGTIGLCCCPASAFELNSR